MLASQLFCGRDAHHGRCGVGPAQAQRALENQEQRKLQKKLDDIRMQIATLQDALRAETEAAAKQKAGNSFAANLQKNVKVRSRSPVCCTTTRANH
jgi:predicted transcriptional regulator